MTENETPTVSVESMRKPLCGVGVLVGCIVVNSLSAAAQSGGFRDELDAFWDDTNPAPRGNWLQFLVKAWPQRLYRGRISPHDCLVNAIRDYRNGDHEEAMGWIQGAFCPNLDAQQRLMRQAPAVLDHLLTKYGPAVVRDGVSGQ